MTKAIRFLFGLAAYFFFFATFLYLIGFVTNQLVPRSIDVGPEAGGMTAILVNLLLIGLFGFQHSVMARPGFKEFLTRFWPSAIERSLYVAMSAVALVVLFHFWIPMPTLVWSVSNEAARAVIWTFAGLGWGIVLISKFILYEFVVFFVFIFWC